MIDELKRVFGRTLVEDCKCPDDSRVLILIEEDDSTNRSRIVPVGSLPLDSNKIFTCINPDSRIITHIAIDNCLLASSTGYAGKKCDLVVFDDKEFCFVELKTNATSNKQKTNNVRKAIIQLGTTINHFDDLEVDFSTHSLKAFVVLQTPLYPQNRASKINRKVKFYNDYEVDLFEQNSNEF